MAKYYNSRLEGEGGLNQSKYHSNIQNSRSKIFAKSERTASSELTPEQFSVLLGTAVNKSEKFSEKSPKLEEVLVAMEILPSVGSIISHKKDCLKVCDHPKKF